MSEGHYQMGPAIDFGEATDWQVSARRWFEMRTASEEFFGICKGRAATRVPFSRGRSSADVEVLWKQIGELADTGWPHDVGLRRGHGKVFVSARAGEMHRRMYGVSFLDLTTGEYVHPYDVYLALDTPENLVAKATPTLIPEWIRFLKGDPK